MEGLPTAAGTIVVLSVICTVLEFLCPNGRLKKSINIVIGLTYTVAASKAILELMGI